MSAGKSGGLSPRQGTYLVGIVNFLACIVSIYPVNKFGRRTVLLGGHICMTLFMVLIGVF